MHDDVKNDVLAALKEQASEARHHIGTPGYSRHDLMQNSLWFDTVADWLDDNWPNIFPEEQPA